MRKIFWFDTETTGLGFNKCSILQLAALIEQNGEIIEKCVFHMQPHMDALVDQKATDKHGITPEMWQHFDTQEVGINKLRAFLARHVNKYNRLDKFVVAGYNVNFDVQMLRAAFLRDGDKFFGSWFFWPVIDVQTYVAEGILSQNLNLPNYQLSTVCKHCGIDIVAHDALSDIHATRNLYKYWKGI